MGVDIGELSVRPVAREIVIEPRRRRTLGVVELVTHRELLYLLTWRDVKLRYKQTFFGASWALIQPLILMGVFGLFFGRLAGLPSDGLPYSVFVLAALVPWTFFSNAFGAASRSVVSSAALVSKVFFPRILIPFASAAAFLIDLVIATLLLEVIACFWGIYPTWRVALLPFLMVFGFLIAMAFGVWLAALNVRYRDVAYTVPFMVQALMFASPIGYPSSIIPDQYRALYGLNPLTGLIEGFRWAAVGATTSPGRQVLISLVITLLMLAGGLLYFNRHERSFADVI